MKTVSIEMSVEIVSQMISDKMKSDKEFSVFVVGVLQESYRLDFVIDAMQNGISVSKYEIGEQLLTEERYYNSDTNEYEDIDLCVLSEFRPYEKYNRYIIEFVKTDKDGNKVDRATYTSEDKLSRPAGQK